ncbi:MAG: diaminopimelate decarboxylase [Candidatus Firestonebacteria bacterium]
MHYFFFKNNYLYCENIKVVDITKKVQTPFYLYSHRTIYEHFAKIDEAFKNIPTIICYSLKANSNLSILKILQKAGSGADIVSGGELYKSLKAGIPPKKIVFAGVGKTEEEIEYAIKSNILMFNIESVTEAVNIGKIARRLKRRIDVALRINPDVDVDTHHYITTGKKENKFGLNIDLAKNLFTRLNKLKNLNICGIHIHLGSQITKVEPYIMAIQKIIGLINNLKEMGVCIKRLNIGGGLGIIYKDESPSTAKEFADNVLPLIKPLGVTLILEPGRFIVGNAGILVAKVLCIKKAERKNFIIVDAGMNDLIRPSLYGAYHHIIPIVKTSGVIKADVVGPICESGDFLGKDRKLPKVKEGDFLAVMSAGAYGFSMASNYNARRKPAEVMVRDDKFWVVRKRESFEDLIKGER